MASLHVKPTPSHRHYLPLDRRKRVFSRTDLPSHRHVMSDLKDGKSPAFLRSCCYRLCCLLVVSCVLAPPNPSSAVCGCGPNRDLLWARVLYRRYYFQYSISYIPGTIFSMEAHLGPCIRSRLNNNSTNISVGTYSFSQKKNAPRVGIGQRNRLPQFCKNRIASCPEKTSEVDLLHPLFGTFRSNFTFSYKKNSRRETMLRAVQIR